MTLKKTPAFYHVDFMALDSPREGANVLYFVEMKHRRIKSTRFPNYLLSLKKWINMNEISRYSGVPVHLVVRFTDLDLCLNVSKRPHRLTYMGRKDRGDEYDMEPCILIPLKLFRTVEGIKRARLTGGN